MSRVYLDRGEREQAKRMLEVTPFVFVYGTLKKGHGNNALLSTSDFVGEDATTDGWLLGSRGCPYAFPSAVVPEKYKELLRPIKGEIYRVLDPQTAITLDCLEGWHPDPDHAHYWRRIVTTKVYKLSCWIYTREHFATASYCNACNLTEQGEWVWSRN